MKATTIITNFTTGALSPRLFGHVDLTKFHNAAKIILNFIVMAQGGAYRRMGTYFVAEAKSVSGNIKLLKFKMSLTVAFIVEVTEGWFRFYNGAGSVLDHTNSAPYEISQPYTSSQILDIKTAQMNDVMIVCHKDVQTRQFNHFADKSWSIQKFDFVDGPYLPENITEIMVTPTYKGTTVNYDIVGAAYRPGIDSIVVGTISDGYIDRSTDSGLTWSQVLTGSRKFRRARAILNEAGTGLAYYATAKAGDVIYSEDGTTWSTGIGPGGANSINDITRHLDIVPSLYCIVGSGGYIATEPNHAAGWTARVSGTTYDLNGCCYNSIEGKVYAVGDNGVVLSSSDCVTWAVVNVGSYTSNFKSINMVYETMFIVGSDGIILTNSYVGDSHGPGHSWTGWVKREAYTTNTLNNVEGAFISGEYKVMAQGENGTLLFSTIPNVTINDAAPASLNFWHQINLNPNLNFTSMCCNGSVCCGSNSLIAIRDADNIDSWQMRCIRTASLVASAALFKSDDVGRWFRFKEVSGGGTPLTNWTYGKIIKVTDDDAAVMETRNYFSTVTATKSWRMGAFGGNQGYPKVAGFSKQRLWFVSTPGNPLGVWSSMSGDFWNFGPSAVNGTVTDNCSIYGSMVSDGSAEPKWLISGKKIVIGTETAEFVIKPAAETSPLSPTNVDIDSESVWGAANVLPLKIGSVILFLQQVGRKLMEFMYQITSDSYEATDLTILSEHITAPAIDELVYQQNPDELIWGKKSNGELVALTYQRKNEVVAWHSHKLSNGSVEAIGCIPSTDTSFDQLWLSVTYLIKGTPKRYILKMAKPWNYQTDVLASYFGVDCGFIVPVVAPMTTYTLAELSLCTVDIVVNGQYKGQVTVSGAGEVLFPEELNPGDLVYVGLPMQGRVTLLHSDPPYPTGSSQGHTRRVHRLMVRVLDTIGLSYSNDGVKWHTAKDKLKNLTTPYSGLSRIDYEGQPELDDIIYFKQDTPVPCTILGIIREMEVND